MTNKETQHSLEQFGVRLGSLIFEHFASKAEFAKAIGVDKAQVTRWVDGKAYPRADTLLMIADLFECDCHYLLTGAKADYASINRTTGLNNNAIDVLAKSKDLGSQYIPVCDLKTSEVLNIALSNEAFVTALADYLTSPSTSVFASARIINQPKGLIEGARAWGENTFCIDIENKPVNLRPLLKAEFENALERVLESVQEEIDRKLTMLSKLKEKNLFEGTGYEWVSIPLLIENRKDDDNGRQKR